MKKLLVLALSLALGPMGFAQSSGLPGPIIYAVATGSVHALAVTQNGAQLIVGQQIVFLRNLANTTTSPTLAVNGGTAKTITKYGQLALATGDLTTTAIATVIYDGTDYELQNPQTSGVGTLGIANGGTGQTTAAAAFNALNPMTTTGDIIYESAANTASRLAGSTSSSPAILVQTGNGSTSAAPAWSTTPTFSGANITALNGSNITSGIVPVANGGWGANFAAHFFLGNSTGSTAAPTAGLLGAYDVSVPSYIAGGGSVNAYTATYSPAVPALTAGLQVFFLPGATSTSTTPTLAVNGLTAKTITKFGTAALASGDLNSAVIASVIYDGTEWQLQNPATLSTVLTGVPTLVASEETVASSATPTFSTSFRHSYNLLTANVTSFTLSAPATNGQEKTLEFCQNGTGGYTVTAPSNVHGFMVVGALASKCSAQHFSYDTNQTAWIADGPGVINQ